MLAARPLSAHWHDTLVSGEHGYASRSEAVMAVTLAMVNARWDWPDYYAAMTDETNGLSAWALRRSGSRRRRSRRDAYRRLARTWDKAVARVQDRPAVRTRTEIRQQIALMMDRAKWWGWTGRTKVLDQRLLAAIHRRFAKLGKLVWSISVREASWWTGRGLSTVARALHRLVERGWLRLESPGHLKADGTALAATYRLVCPDQEIREVGSCSENSHARRGGPSSGGGVPVCDTSGVDVFSALGLHAAHLYDALSTGSMSARELAEMTGLHRSTVYRQAPRLIEAGLVVKDEHGLYHRTEQDLDKAAAELGVVGHAEAKRRRYELAAVAFTAVAKRMYWKRVRRAKRRAALLREERMARRDHRSTHKKL